ncbi:hypothetical protein GA0070216_10892 [Micromonospora matsumotoense]|uniref:Uncharacterized protein n=1 Tax=Micromonospora matsumotoense TaxID=121616 RepID=A0A1C4Z2U6_9ACTN|nr:hypothetical protein [Micromonospora matsumotoense]SCF27214.1 hypothetical protein GA0070216_10892 [Micromonospora matsumotoense]
MPISCPDAVLNDSLSVPPPAPAAARTTVGDLPGEVVRVRGAGEPTSGAGPRPDGKHVPALVGGGRA